MEYWYLIVSSLVREIEKWTRVSTGPEAHPIPCASSTGTKYFPLCFPSLWHRDVLPIYPPLTPSSQESFVGHVSQTMNLQYQLNFSFASECYYHKENSAFQT